MRKPRYLPDRPTEDLLRRVHERIAVHLMEVLGLCTYPGRTSDPIEIVRHRLTCTAAEFGTRMVNTMRELGHAIDYRHATNGDTLRYVADLCDWCDHQSGQWKDWDNEDGSPIALPCIDEGRPVPYPLLPPANRKRGPVVLLEPAPC